MNEKIIARFWSRVDRREDNECWLWMAYRNKKGYGLFWNGDATKPATHFALALIGIIVPDGLEAAHSCHNPTCVNPRHLHIATGSENTLESFRDGRKDFRGEGCPRAKLTENDVLEIRRRYAEEDVTIEQIAASYNVCKATISHIVNRRNWRHI